MNASHRTPLVIDGLAIVAAIHPKPGAVPARFDAALPAVSEVGDFVCDAPPAWWIIHRLAAGDADMQRRFLDLCARASTTVLNVSSVDFMAQWLAQSAADSRGAAFAQRLLHLETLDQSLIRALRDKLVFYARLYGVEAASLGIPQPASDNPPPEAYRVESVAPDDPIFDSFFEEHPRALYDANVCAKVSGGVSAMLRRRPDAIVEAVASLQCFIEYEGHPWLDRLGRLEELAAIHRQSAQNLVAHVESLSPFARFFDDGELARYAQARHLPLRTASGITLQFSLDNDSVSMNTDVWPNGADGDLRKLARRSRALDGALFEEIPHKVDDYRASPEMLEDRYRLRAYVEGMVWEVIAGNTSDWLDVPAMVGLLNAVLVHKKARERFFVLCSQSEDASIVCASSAGVTQAVADGLLCVDTDTAFAFEDVT